MAFYRSDSNMHAHLEGLLDQLETDGRPGLRNSIALTWIRYNKADPAPCSGFGTGWCEERLLYPASVVKLIYAIAVEQWLHKDLLPESEELRRALKEMVLHSSNDATSLIVDLLTGTSSGPSLQADSWENWKQQRQLVNKWLNELGWPELKSINCCQKTWEDGPYGRERDFYGAMNGNRNALTTSATARMLEGIMTNGLISPRACKRLRELFARSIDLINRKENPENQVDGFIGEGLPQGSRLWSKAGWMSQARHDAAWWNSPGKSPMLLVVFSLGKERAKDELLLPEMTKQLASFPPH